MPPVRPCLDILLALMALWAIAVLRQINGPLYTARFTRSIPPDVRATVLSMRGQVNAWGQIVRGPGVGAIGNRSLRAAMVAVGMVLTPILPLFLDVRRATRSASTAEPEVALAEEK
jgi:hypothetical protein